MPRVESVTRRPPNTHGLPSVAAALWLACGLGLAQPPEGVPPEAWARCQAGLAHKKAGDMGKAEQELRKALELHTDYLEAHWVLAWVCGEEGKTDEACTEFSEFVRLAEDTEEVDETTGKNVALAKKKLEELGCAKAPPTGGITVAVRDAEGKPVVGAEVVTAGSDVQGTTGFRGDCQLADLATGTHRLTVSKEGYQQVTGLSVTVAEGVSTPTQVVLTPSLGALRVQVTSLGRELAGARVSTDAGGHAGNTDYSGSCTLGDVKPGSYEVRASKDNYEPTASERVSVRPGEETRVEFELTPKPGSISGVVKTHKGRGARKLTVVTSPGEHTSTTDREGRFTLESVPAGTYKVAVRKGEEVLVEQSGVTVGAGGSATADFGLPDRPSAWGRVFAWLLGLAVAVGVVFGLLRFAPGMKTKWEEVQARLRDSARPRLDGVSPDKVAALDALPFDLPEQAPESEGGAAGAATSAVGQAPATSQLGDMPLETIAPSTSVAAAAGVPAADASPNTAKDPRPWGTPRSTPRGRSLSRIAGDRQCQVVASKSTNEVQQCSASAHSGV